MTVSCEFQSGSGRMRGCFKGMRVHCYDVIIFVDESGGFIRHRVQETRQSRRGGRGREGGRSIPPSASGRSRGSLRFFPRLRVRSDFMRHECLAGLLPSHGVRKKGPK